MGVLKKLTSEYFGETERKEDMIELPEGVIRVDFTDRNGVRHKNGYRVDGSRETLKKLIGKLMDKRGVDCDLNDVDVSGLRNTSFMFYHSAFNGDISGWDVSNVRNMGYMFKRSAFTGENGGISKWDVSGVGDMSGMFAFSPFDGDIFDWNVSKYTITNYMFLSSPLESNPPEWYHNTIQ